MTRLTILLMAFTLFTGIAFAQDPGIQDSVIVGSVHVDSGETFAFIPIWAVTDDSVACYNIPLAWHAPLGGVHGVSGTLYFPPLTNWDERYDTLMLNEGYFRIIGFSDLGGPINPPLLTQGERTHILSLRFIIDPTTPSQLVVLDTTYDPRNGSLGFCLADGLTEFVPAFQPGFISIGEVGVEEALDLPVSFNLSRNYPNPFNPSTNIDFALPSAQHVTLDVYNVLGQHIRTLIRGDLEAGQYSSTWNGRDKSGTSVPSGIYFYKLTAGSFSETQKMLMLK
jgi:hypothetical protein